jgi:hypothetical protein
MTFAPHQWGGGGYAKICIVAKSKKDLQQAQRAFFSWEKFIKKVRGKKLMFATFKLCGPIGS